MITIELYPKTEVVNELDLKNLSNIDFKKYNQKLVSSIQLTYNFRKKKLGDLFNIKIKNNKDQRLIINGSNNFFKNLGSNWKSDNLIINGDTGSYLGYKMHGGRIEVNGSCKNFVGCKMTGGKIIVNKNVGDYVGGADYGEKIGMNGGVIVVKKNAGNYVGSFMRRGLIVVEGDINKKCANNLIAGTIISKGNVSDGLGYNMKRGTIIMCDESAIPKRKFTNCGEQTIKFLEIFRRYYKEDVKIPKSYSKFIKYVGNIDNNGLGEILYVV